MFEAHFEMLYPFWVDNGLRTPSHAMDACSWLMSVIPLMPAEPPAEKFTVFILVLPCEHKNASRV